MNALAVALEVPAILLGPLICRTRGHRWHAWPFHAASAPQICTRCGNSPKESR